MSKLGKAERKLRKDTNKELKIIDKGRKKKKGEPKLRGGERIRKYKEVKESLKFFGS